MLLATTAFLAGLFLALEAKEGVGSGFIRAPARRSPLSRQLEPGMFRLQVGVFGLMAGVFLATGTGLGVYAVHEAWVGASDWTRFLWFDLGWVTGACAGMLTLAFTVLDWMHLR